MPLDTDADRLRQQVLQSMPWAPTATTNVSYVAANRLLIIGDEKMAAELESLLPEKILCYNAQPAQNSRIAKPLNGHLCAGLVVSGYLGRFKVLIDQHQTNKSQDQQVNNLANILGIESGYFDQVLDCGDEPIIEAVIKPPGYYFLAGDEQAKRAAIENIPEMIGEFKKPKYFDYDASICAHGRSGISGCTRCLDACPTDAITSIGETIEVNSHLCQGGGVCASSCPTGAITYLYPKSDEQTELLRSMLKSLREGNGNQGISLLLFDNEHGRDAVSNYAPKLAGNIVPFVVEEIGSLGLEVLACALAYGANQVLLYAPEGLPESVLKTLRENVEIIGAVLAQTNCQSHQIKIISDLSDIENHANLQIIDDVAKFAPIGDKRSVIRSALTFFSELPTNNADHVSLPDGALFGQVHLDMEGCTLCMGCVSVCPAGTLLAGGDTPALKFVEANCVQCGLCTQACPESVISLEPILHFDYNTIREHKVLKEEAPFLCISCGKAFATKAMITKMMGKLKGHWMFEKPDDVNRLKMCEDCRVKDMFDKNDMA